MFKETIGAMNIPRPNRRTIGIDMTPMIDCVFQLLIFFMLSSSMLAPPLTIQLPKASAVAGAVKPPAVVISVDKDGRFLVNSEVVPPTELEAKLRPILAEAKEKVVYFRGDANMDYKHFVRAVDAARAVGAVGVDIAYEPAENNPGATGDGK